MMQINFSNVEQIIFEDPKAHKIFPSYFSGYFETWKLGKQIPRFKQLGKEAVLDLLNGIRDEHIEAMEKYFGERVIVEKLYYNTTRNIKIPISDSMCDQLCEILNFTYFSTWRDEDYLYISFWR
jgi:hypothetical protein